MAELSGIQNQEWEIVESGFWNSSLKKFLKRHKAETEAMLANLATYELALKNGVQPSQFKAGFIHNERNGLVAIDQSGSSVRNPKQTRMYVYAWVWGKELHLIKIGDKTAQKKDVNDCKTYISPLKNVDKEKGGENDKNA